MIFFFFHFFGTQTLLNENEAHDSKHVFKKKLKCQNIKYFKQIITSQIIFTLRHNRHVLEGLKIIYDQTTK